jgi:hypothetical protein
LQRGPQPLGGEFGQHDQGDDREQDGHDEAIVEPLEGGEERAADAAAAHDPDQDPSSRLLDPSRSWGHGARSTA